MSLDESVDLVLHAFSNSCQGDIFVQKAPASSIIDLATALKNIFNSSSSIQVIGPRHGEKLFETLISREEMSSAEDNGKYYRLPSDNRDLNYSKYFDEGTPLIASFNDYTSHNTNRLSVPEIESLLLNLPEISSLINA